MALSASAACSIIHLAYAQQATSSSVPPAPTNTVSASTYSVVSNSAHYRVWSRISSQTND
jgi:hypothetical protein